MHLSPPGVWYGPLFACAVASLAASAGAAAPERVYRDKCAICHDDGGGGAPRLGVRPDWSSRLSQGRAVLHRNSIDGIPGTAMVARGGFPELTDAEVVAAVDYLLASVGVAPDLPLPPTGVRAAKAAGPAAPFRPVDDATLLRTAQAALAGEKDIAMNSVRIAAKDGVVTLAGVVENGDQIRRAGAAVAALQGVRRIENNLQTKGMFNWD